MATAQKKVTVTLPETLLERLNSVVPSRKRSLFITEAIAEHLDLIEQSLALEEAAGVWTDARHPDLKTVQDIDAWVKDLREGWR